MNDRVLYSEAYRGEFNMRRRGFKRLASRVWQKSYPDSPVHIRALVSEDFLTVDFQVLGVVNSEV